MRTPPVIQSFRAARAERDCLTLAFHALLAVFALCLAPLPFSRTWQVAFMKSQHLRAESFAVWGLGQMTPSMYTFANRVWISEEPIDRDTLDMPAPPRSGRRELWYNHYPPSSVTWRWRKHLWSKGRNTYFRFESRYRGTVVGSDYSVRPTRAGLWMDLKSND